MPMMADLENLVELQKIELEIAAIQSRLKEIPREVEGLEREIATEKAAVKTVEDKLAETQKRRRGLEGELELIEQKISKYKDQLMEVKSNEEYRAMQKQIAHAQEDVSNKEDEILISLEQLDQLNADLRKRQEELKRGQARVQEMEADLEKEVARLRDELAGRTGRREELVAKVPEDLLSQYEKVAQVRGGVAMAEAKDEHCQVCHVRLRPQAYNEVRVGSKILRCDSCGRILYYTGPPPSASADEATAEV